MATYYVPNEAGWDDTGMFGSAAQLRLKLETVYNGLLNRSEVTVSLEARLPSDSGDYLMAENASLDFNGSALFSGGGSMICFNGTGAWCGLRDSMSGAPLRWTVVVDHAQDGTASVTLAVHVRLYKSSSLYLTWYGKSAVQAIDETRQFTLTISVGTGCGVAVSRGGTALADGATICCGDVLTVSFSALSGYALLTHTVNGAAFESGGTLTVTGPVTAAATARRRGLLHLDTGTALLRCRVLLDTGSALVPVRLFLDRGDRITEAGT